MSEYQYSDIYKLPAAPDPPSSGGNQGGNGGNKPPTTPPTPPPQPPSSGDSTGSQNGNPSFDLFGTSGNYIAQPQKADSNFMTQYYIQQYNALRCDLWFYDFSGGMDAQVRRISEGVISNELAYSMLDVFPRTMMLPPLVTSDTTAGNTIGTLEAMSACYLNDGGTPRWLVAAGDTANKSLFALTTAVTAQTYTPGSNIVSLTTAKIATNTERVIVGRAGAAAQVLTGFNGTPTTSGTMHANTSGCWAVIRSPLNSTIPGAETLLMYCGASGATLYSLSSTAAIGDAPTAVLTNWPSGGYGLGIATLTTEGVARAGWVHPLNSQSTSMLDSMAPGRVVTTNLEGTDPKYLDMKLPFVKHAMLWRGGIVATDGKQVHWNNGDVIDLGWNRERFWNDPASPTSLGFGTVQCLAVVDERLFVCSSAIILDANDVVFSVWEEYLPESNTWKFIAKASPSNGLLPNVAAFTGKTPVYQPFDTAVDNGIFYWYTKVGGGLIAATYEWDSIPLLADGVNPQWQQAASAWISYKFEPGTGGAATSRFADTPTYHYMGLPMIVSDIWFGGTLPGEDSKVWIEMPYQTSSGFGYDDLTTPLGLTQKAAFEEDTDWRRHWWFNPEANMDSPPLVDRLKFRIHAFQGTSGSNVTKTSPNTVPFRVGFYVYLNGKYTSPKVMEPDRYWGNLE